MSASLHEQIAQTVPTESLYQPSKYYELLGTPNARSRLFIHWYQTGQVDKTTWQAISLRLRPENIPPVTIEDPNWWGLETVAMHTPLFENREPNHSLARIRIAELSQAEYESPDKYLRSLLRRYFSERELARYVEWNPGSQAWKYMYQISLPRLDITPPDSRNLRPENDYEFLARMAGYIQAYESVGVPRRLPRLYPEPEIQNSAIRPINIFAVTDLLQSQISTWLEAGQGPDFFSTQQLLFPNQ